MHFRATHTLPCAPGLGSACKLRVAPSSLLVGLLLKEVGRPQATTASHPFLLHCPLYIPASPAITSNLGGLSNSGTHTFIPSRKSHLLGLKWLHLLILSSIGVGVPADTKVDQKVSTNISPHGSDCANTDLLLLLVRMCYH